MRHIAFVLLGSFCEPGPLRLWAALLLALVPTGAVYYIALPEQLPLWPAFVALVAAAIAGLLWEDRYRREQGLHFKPLEKW